VHIAFFSGNEVYWKTRWENSIDGANTPYRTLVCYKEGTLGENVCNSECDPSSNWTGLWRSGCGATATDACKPENALTGQISWELYTGSIVVPALYKNHRFWRNTSVASLSASQSVTLPFGTLGYETDFEQASYLTSYPYGRITLSNTAYNGKVHKLSLYRHPSGALVFGAGTVQWSWGLDDKHDRGNAAPSPIMQQATVNLFADMGVQPGTLQTGLVPATASTDITTPVTTITSPASGTTFSPNVPITISGTCSDDKQLAGVEISVDGGVTWKLLDGTSNWSYTWTPPAMGTYSIKVRGYDDSGNMEVPGTAPASDAITVNVSQSSTLPPSQGPGGPILVVSTSANPFSQYTAEILRAQGFNAFAAIDVSTMTASLLNNYDVVILGEMTLTPGQVTDLTNWTNAGGTLIALKPGSELNTLMGISTVTGEVAEGYLLVNKNTEAGKGIVNQTIQFHGSAKQYTLNGATSVATLYSNANTATNYACITQRQVGSNGGYAIAFAYDLNKSIVYTRQGNPAWSGQKRDGTSGPIRSDDLFYPNWVNLDKVAIPQADEQQHLLSNLIHFSNLHRKPLPRFWFLPRGFKAAVVMSGDDHASGGASTASRFDRYKGQSNSNTVDAVANWDAVRATSYIFPGTAITNTQVISYQQEGFEIGLHLNTGCANFTASTWSSNWNSQLTSLKSQLPNLNPVGTNRTHCIAFSDYSTQPKKSVEVGVRMDVNYYYWPGSWVLDRPGMFTGSGIPMRFADINGALIDCYQVTTQLTDESEQNLQKHITSLLDSALGKPGYYGVFCANMHTDNSHAQSLSGSDIIVTEAKARSVPVVSTRQMLDWVDGRNNSSFTQLAWNGSQLSFKISAAAGSRNMRAMLPAVSGLNKLATISYNGSPIAIKIDTIKGVPYAFFDATLGTALYSASYLPPSPPTITVQPQSQQICAGNIVTFSSEVSSMSNSTVQWQLSTDNGSTWVNLTGAISPEFSFSPLLTDNGKRYRAVWTNSVGSTVSNNALLTVNTIPAAPTGNGFINFCNAATVADLTAAGTSIKWYSTASGGATLSSSTSLVNGNNYYASQTINGCESNNRLDVKVSVNISTNTTFILDGSRSAGPISGYLWTLVSGPNIPVIQNPTAAVTTVSGLLNGTYVFNLTLNGGLSQSRVLVNVNPPDTPIVAHAGFDRSIALPSSSVILNGSGSRGAIASYAWSRLSGPNVPAMATPTSVSTSVNGLVQGVYTFELAVKDAQNVTRRDTVAVTVTASSGSGISPVINATHTASSSTGTTVNTLSNVGTGSLLALSVSQAERTSTLFTAAQAIQPSTTDASNDGLAVELGMRFQSSEDGYITGIRFYKALNNTGTHTGELYTSTGTRLAQAVFTNETASGWQQVNFSTPVFITKGTTYVAAYHSSAGFFSRYTNYFQNSITEGALTGLADGIDGSNGLYGYGNTPFFPTQSYAKTNYWVDVVFAQAHATVSSTPSLVWTRRADAQGLASSGNAELYTARYAAGGNINITTSWGSSALSTAAYSISNYDTSLTGVSASATGQSVPSVTVTTSRSNSLLLAVTSDRNGVSGSSRSYRDAATETFYNTSAGVHSAYHYRKASTTAGSYTEGLTAPTGMSAGTALWEVMGPPGPPPDPVADAGYNQSVILFVPPAGKASQTFCQNATVGNLVTNANQVRWYTASTGGALLSSSQALTNGSRYYASQLINGCETNLRLEVTAFISIPPRDTIFANVCSNKLPYLWRSKNYYTSGIFTDTLRNSTSGCDTLMTLYLNVNQLKSDTVSFTICSNNAPFLWYGRRLYTSGVYVDTVTTLSGQCDSIHLLNLTVLNAPDIPSIDTFKQCDGSYLLTARVQGKYLWNTGDTLSSIRVNTSGTYSIQVTNQNGCTASSSITLSSVATVFSALVYNKVDVKCFGDLSGAFTIGVQGSRPPFLYSLDNIVFDTVSYYKGLPAGNYKVYVRDASGCISTAFTQISQPSSRLFINVTKSNVEVTGAETGSIFIAASGGVGGYRYSLSNGPLQDFNYFLRLGAGYYMASAFDANGCSMSQQVFIQEPFDDLSCTENTWAGGISQAWEDPLNWTCGKVPTSNSNVKIPANTIFSPVISSHVVVRSLSVSSSALLLVREGYSLKLRMPNNVK
jgi:hypothetical protein